MECSYDIFRLQITWVLFFAAFNVFHSIKTFSLKKFEIYIAVLIYFHQTIISQLATATVNQINNQLNENVPK